MIKSITIENKSMVSLHGVKPGKQVIINVDADGVPLEQCWRRRMNDSKTDGCILVIESIDEITVLNKSVKATKKEAE